MRKILYMLTALLVLASCTKEQEMAVEIEPKLDLGISFSTKAGGSGSGTVQEPVINCMRVLIFYGADQTQPVAKAAGALAFNTFYAFGFNTTEGTGKYTVKLANQIVLPQSDCRDYKVYVVLNEEGFTLSGTTPEDLHTKLGDFEGNETALQNILSTPAVYTEVLKNTDEPAFLISGCKAVTFINGELGSGKSVIVDGEEGFNRGRSMAQIVINKITSEPADGVDYSSTDVPLIFVKSVTLENVPDAISWSNDDGKIGTVGSTAVSAMTAVPVGAAKNHTDGSGEYYDRDWYGHITRTISNLWAQKVQYTDAKLYRTDDNSNDTNKKKWSFFVKPYRTGGATDNTHTTPYVFQYAQGGDTNKETNAFKAFEQVPNPALSNTYMDAIFAATQDDTPEMSENITYTSYEVTGVQKETKNGNTKTSVSAAILSDDYWTVRLGDKFYVPENIQSATTNATCLRIKLAIAQPKFSFRFDSEDDAKNRVCTEDCMSMGKNDYKNFDCLIDPTTLPSPSSLPGESGLTYSYYVDYTEIKYKDGTATKTDMSKPFKGDGTLDVDNKWMMAYGHIAYADDASNIIEYQDSWYNNKGEITIPNDFAVTNENGFHAYIDGFNRKSNTVQTDIVVNETLKGSKFSWNVPASDDATTHVYDFVIPVNNNIDGASPADYSVHRNTRYTVTLYVNAATYTSLSTKSGESCPFTITAKVTTETVSDNEE